MRRLAGISSRTLARAGRALARLGGGELTSAGRDALAQARAAAGRGEAGVLQGLVPVAVTRLRPVGPTPVDAPIVDTAEQGEPAPAPSLRAASTLEIALSPCDGTGLWTPFGDPYLARVRGRLLPERQGSLVRVTHRRFSGSTPIDPLVHTVQTDAEGWWEDTVTPDDWSAGYGPRWEIQASFQGDAERLPGESTICAVRAHYP